MPPAYPTGSEWVPAMSAQPYYPQPQPTVMAAMGHIAGGEQAKWTGGKWGQRPSYPRREEQQTPSAVLMLRSVPSGTTERDLEAWANQYDIHHPTEGRRKAKCVKSLLLPDKDIGFVQMGDIEEAKCIMDMYQTRPELIQMHRPDGTMQGLNLVFSDKPDIKAQTRLRNQIPTSQTRILLVVLKNLSAVIMMDEIFWIFSQFGTVEKLSSFTKNMKNQVLVQYQTQEQASLAMAYLNGKTITFASPAQQPHNEEEGTTSSGSCHMAIVPSKLPELTFKNQDQKNRDYTQINEQLRWHFLQARLGNSELKASLQTLGTQFKWRIRDFLWGVWVLGNGWCDPQQDSKWVGQIPVDPASQGKGIPEGQVGDCIHVSGLPHEGPEHTGEVPAFTAQMLWRVFGMYGEILAVKRLWKYQGSAIVQYKNQRDARQAMEYLRECSLDGRRWQVSESKNANAMHWSGAKTELQTNMCTISDEGVTAPRVPPGYLLTRPSDTLHLFDLPSSVTRDELLAVFDSSERRVRHVEVVEGRAAVQFTSVDHAVIAAAQLNGERVRLPSQAEEHSKSDKKEAAEYNGTTLHIHFDKHPQRQHAAPRTPPSPATLVPPPPPPPPGQPLPTAAVRRAAGAPVDDCWGSPALEGRGPPTAGQAPTHVHSVLSTRIHTC